MGATGAAGITGMTGMIFNIQRFSIHDGPGIRTTVFLKGCSLKCFWCHNPESVSHKPQLLYYPDKCISCGKCAAKCHAGAHKIGNGIHLFDRSACKGCGECADSCYAQALMQTGRQMNVGRVIGEVVRDDCFYRKSGGGVTFSGGEPMLQIDFLCALLAEAKKHGIHTAIDTAGNVPWEYFLKAIPFTDLFLFDVKAADPGKHKHATGSGNERILDNLRKLGTIGRRDPASMRIWIRIPVIPALNDSKGEMEAILAKVSGLDVIDRVELIPFHSLGREKYSGLGIGYKAEGYKRPDGESVRRFAKIFSDNGFNTFVA